MRIVATIVAFLLELAASATAGASPTEIYALIVTNNQGSALGRPDLQYADDDGAKYYEFFSMLTPEENISLLTRFDRDTSRLFPELASVVGDPTRAALVATARRVARSTEKALSRGRRVELYFVFAGHGDMEKGRGFVELEDGSFSAEEMRRYIFNGIPATRIHFIADSCNSFFLIHARKPGGRRFDTPAEAVKKLAEKLPHVGVFLSTNAEAEVYEWSELQSGIFSHAVRSGLSGGADSNGDSRVSYQELEAFVNTAVAEVKNPVYRPTVFASGPREGQTLMDLRATRATTLGLAGSSQRRLTVRDQEGLAWIDIHKEAGASVALRLGPRLMRGGWVDELSVDGARSEVGRRYALGEIAGGEMIALADLPVERVTKAARGPGVIFKNLFLRPFGPKAYSAYQRSAASSPAPVFGISREDSERMQLLLENIGNVEHRSRMMGTSGLVGLGALVLGAGIWILRDDAGENLDSLGLPLTIVGAGSLAAGAIGLWKRSPAEKLHARFVRGLSRGDDPALVVAETEKELYRVAQDYRRTRMLMRWTGLGIAVTAASVFVANEVRGNASFENRFSLGLLTATGGWVAFSSLYEYPIERMVMAWEKDPGIRRLPRLALAPLRGGVMLGLSGTFH